MLSKKGFDFLKELSYYFIFHVKINDLASLKKFDELRQDEIILLLI